ncbi:metallophosphoesterase family protein [Falsibacillus pallidus]|uniref:Putative phosphoesterase n=1 Tax=Falsibacillus pallidus TaxID=493781 RepID=A0A370GPS7_9BACI|nr:metallophosphoesterase family protein [Falsibacillus pallidus]RDI45725.1 putative phosphoesterase [Falsibacillus pallidus]
MKIALLSDIHGNAIALKSVIKDIKSREIEQICVLGDICFRGPEPQRSLDLVRSLDANVIKGNADEWIIRGIKDGEVPETVFNCMAEEREWTVNQLDEESIKYLCGLSNEIRMEVGSLKILMFHATPDSLFEVILPDASDTLMLEKMMKDDSNIYIYSHIHKPFIRFINGKCVMNTGSVGMPFDGRNESSYIILEINQDSFHSTIVRVKYDVEHAIQQYEKSNYPNKEQMISILKTGRV